jgi:hypothetical protein
MPFLLPLLYQVGLGYTPVQSGLLIMPQPLAAMSLKMTMPKILPVRLPRVLLSNTVGLGAHHRPLRHDRAGRRLPLIVRSGGAFGFLSSLQFTSMNTLVYADLATPTRAWQQHREHGAADVDELRRRRRLAPGRPLPALALNLRVLGFGFLYLRDDDVNVTLNPHMGGLSADRLAWMFTDWSYVRRYIPLGWLNFSATYEFAGLTRPYHAVGARPLRLNCALVFAPVLARAAPVRPAAATGGLSAWDVGAAALAAAGGPSSLPGRDDRLGFGEPLRPGDGAPPRLA